MQEPKHQIETDFHLYLIVTHSHFLFASLSFLVFPRSRMPTQDSSVLLCHLHRLITLSHIRGTQSVTLHWILSPDSGQTP